MSKPAIPARTWELLTMLRYKRPAGSNAEQDFIRRYLAPLGVKRDKAGNLWRRIGDSPILWSCHTDTVHKTEGTQRISYGANVAAPLDNGDECLGADCTTGVWIMRQMILAEVPGIYVFHAAEEVGGLGSHFIATETPHKLAKVDFAIAFDRKGTTEIITHQGFQRTASDAFAHSLAAALNLPLQPSPNGSFTDTANYAGLVPECTNLAVGYYNQHTAKEVQDVAFAVKLLDAILAADFSTLVCERDPTAPEDEYDRWWSGAAPASTHGSGSALLDYVKRYPQDIADFLEMNGYDIAEIEHAMFGAMNHVH